MDRKPSDPGNVPFGDPSSSSYVQNSIHQEQHNKYATVNIVNQGPDEEAVRQLISQEAMAIGQQVYQTTAGDVIQEVESMKGLHAQELENLRTNMGTEVTSFVQNQIGEQDQRCAGRTRSASKDSAEETKSIVESQAKITNQQLQEIQQRTHTEIQDLRQFAVQDRVQHQDWTKRQNEQMTELKSFIEGAITTIRDQAESTAQAQNPCE